MPSFGGQIHLFSPIRWSTPRILTKHVSDVSFGANPLSGRQPEKSSSTTSCGVRRGAVGGRGGGKCHVTGNVFNCRATSFSIRTKDGEMDGEGAEDLKTN